MGRCWDVDDIDIRPLDDLAIVMVALRVGACRLKGLGQSCGIQVTDREQFAIGVDAVDVAHAHAPAADDGAGELFTRRGMSGTAEQAPGDY